MTSKAQKLFQRVKLPSWAQAAAKLLLILAILALLYQSIKTREGLTDEFYQSFQQVGRWENSSVIALLIVLLGFNLLLEGLKWRLLASKIEHISFGQAMKGVLTGMALSFVSTSYAGNYFGRVWHLKEKKRYEILGGMVVNSLSQAAVTYYFGGIGFLYFLYWKGLYPEWLPIWASILIFMVVGALIIFFTFRSTDIVKKLEGWPWLYNYLKVIESYGLRDSGKLIGLSALRYITFTTQFVICLWLFDPSLPSLHAFSGVSIMYLAKAVIPNVSFLTDLGIRELTAVQLFGSNGFNASEGATMAATLALWGLNLLLPVIVGSLFVWQIKIKQQAEKKD